MSAQTVRHGNCFLLSSASLSKPLLREQFEPDYLRQNDQLESRAEGRGSAWFIRLGDADAVLRHYYRGGMVARISRDRFLWSGLERSRAFAEYRLLQWMWLQGLAVPEPLGARVQRQGLFYSCDLITRTIPDTVTLADRLSTDKLSPHSWARLGGVVRALHDQGVWHADLNAKNILLDPADAVHLIDFDRCQRRRAGGWREANLKRLRRSLHKLLGLGQIQHFAAEDWQSLLRGYHRQ